MDEYKKYTSKTGLVLASIPILWLSSMLIHDLSPKGSFREFMSNLLDKIDWSYVVASGFIGAALIALGFIYIRKIWHLIVGVVSLAISLFFYGLMTGNMGGM